MLSFLAGCTTAPAFDFPEEQAPTFVARIPVDGEAWKVAEARRPGGAILGALSGFLSTGAASEAVIGAGGGAAVSPSEARISGLRQKSRSPEEYNALLNNEIDEEIALWQKLGEIRPAYDPEGYRYITLLLYRKDASTRGEGVLRRIIESSIIETGEPTSGHRRGFVLFETPFKKTFAACIGLERRTRDTSADKEALLEESDLLLYEMAGPAESPHTWTQFAIRSICYDFGEAERMMSAAGLTGAGPYLLTFDGSYLDRMTMGQVPVLEHATACPRYVSGEGYAEVMAVRFPRDPELDATLVDILVKTLHEKNCHTPWLTTLRFQILDTLVRGSRVTRELAQGIVDIVGMAHAASQTDSE
jgi:hypothetical protein